MSDTPLNMTANKENGVEVDNALISALRGNLVGRDVNGNPTSAGDGQSVDLGTATRPFNNLFLEGLLNIGGQSLAANALAVLTNGNIQVITETGDYAVNSASGEALIWALGSGGNVVRGASEGTTSGGTGYIRSVSTTPSVDRFSLTIAGGGGGVGYSDTNYDSIITAIIDTLDLGLGYAGSSVSDGQPVVGDGGRFYNILDARRDVYRTANTPKRGFGFPTRNIYNIHFKEGMAGNVHFICGSGAGSGTSKGVNGSYIVMPINKPLAESR